MSDELLDNFDDALIAVSPDGKVQVWSRGAERLFGHARADATGRRLVDLIPPDHRSDELQRIHRALEIGSATFEVVRRRKDGTAIHLDVSMRTVSDAAGAVKQVAISMKDVSHLKVLREAAAVEARFGDLLEVAPDPMILVNRDGRIVLFNREVERLFGYANNELLGRPIAVLVSEHSRGAHPAGPTDYVLEAATRPMRGRVVLARRKDGTEVPVEISVSPLGAEDSGFVSCSIREVSARRRDDRVPGELDPLICLAQELCRPLHSLSELTAAMAADHASRLGPDALEQLAELRGSAARVDALAGALRLLAHVTGCQLSRDVVDLGSLARAAAARAAADDSHRHLDLVAPEHLPVWADPELAGALIDSLIANSWRFTCRTARPRIEVGSSHENGTRVFFVRDNGAGFALERSGGMVALLQVIERNRELAGTGICLAIAQRIVHRHGGRFWAEGAAGGGGTFYFTLSGPAP
ncbi:MAG TPA: PAS domain S-box protein [Kofleriaceae bacterium]|nr:PAS domain S-box protein [Kofleriaceae bacterium]